MKTTRMGCDAHARRGWRCAIREFVIGGLVIGGFLLAPSVAREALAGEGASTPAKSMQERFAEITSEAKAHKKAHKLAGIQEELAKLEALYEEAEKDDDLREKIVKFIGSLTRGSKDVPLATEMLHALADIGDPRGAKYIKAYLKQPNKKKAPEMLSIAIGTAADVRHECLVGPLLQVVTQSKTFGVAGAAVEVLGRYRDVKKYRNKIIDTLLKTTKKCKPGGQPRMRGASTDITGSGGAGSGTLGKGNGAQARWGALAGRVPAALNDLTGQDIGGIDEWLGILSKYKGKYASLFTEDE